MKKGFYIKTALIVLIAVTLSACTQNLSKEEKPGTIIINNSEESGILNLGIDSVDTFNPLFTSSASVYDAMQLIFDPLFSFDDRLNPICVLCENMTVSEDRKNVTIRVKQGIKWHDGKDFNAVDVLHTVNLIRFNNTKFTTQLSPVVSASCIDNLTVQVGFSRPVPNPEALFSFPIVQESVTTENLSEYIPIGTGAYKYNQKLSFDRISLIAYENYSGQKQTLSEIHLCILKDSTDSVYAFNSGGIDAISSKTLDLKNNSPRGEIVMNDFISDKLTFIGINNKDSVLSGVNTRKAISYLVDKPDIVDNELFQRAVAADIPISPAAWFYPEQPRTVYNNEYIKEILALDGWISDDVGGYTRSKEIWQDGATEATAINERLKCDILVNDDNEERYRIATRIGDRLNNFGIESSIILVSFEDYKQRINDKNYQLFIGEVRVSQNMDPYNLLVSENYFSYYTQKMHDAIYRLGTYTSGEEEKNAYMNFLNVFKEEMPFVPLFFRKESVIFKKSISGTGKPNIFTSYVNPENWYISIKKVE